MDKESTPTIMSLGINLAEIWRLTTDQIEFFWPQLFELVERHPDELGFFYTPESLKEMLESGDIDAWVGFKNSAAEIELAAFLTLEVYPVRTEYKFIWVGGTHWRKFMPGSLDKIEKYAYAKGAEIISGNMRPGWFKLLSPHGFRTRKIVMEKNLIKMRGH